MEQYKGDITDKESGRHASYSHRQFPTVPEIYIRTIAERIANAKKGEYEAIASSLKTKGIK